MIRIAWFDRKTKRYDHGSIQPLSTLSDKVKWIGYQNKMIPTTKYWIEFVNHDISNNTISIENIESIKLIKLEQYEPDDIQHSKSADNYTDYLLL